MYIFTHDISSCYIYMRSTKNKKNKTKIHEAVEIKPSQTKQENNTLNAGQLQGG